MTRRQQNRRSRLENLRSPHRARLYLEPLEARRLLAGLQVSVFVDSDGSRSFEPGVESAAANRLVYVDLNANGRFESAEPIAVTNSQGIAHFDDLADGDYLVGLLTNPATQKTTTSTNVNPIANGLTTGAATVVLADDELEHVWAVDEQGFASRVDDPNDSVDFGGRVLDSLATAENLLVVVKASPSIPSGLASFDLASGAISPIELGSPDFAGTIRELELHNGSITATAEDGDTITVLAVALDGLVAEQTVIVSGQFLAVAANPVEDLVIVAEATEQGSLIYAAGDAVNARGTFEFDSAVASLHFNASGDQLFVTLEEGGVRVLSIGRIGMELEAILSDAAGPMAESLADGRLITASSQADNKLLVWDSNTWQPLGTTELPVNSQLGNLRVDSFGDELLIATTLGIYSAELAVPVGLPIEVAGDATSAAILGVRPLGSNNAPQTDSGVRRSVDEDNVDTFGSDELPVTDADGDTLWFRLQAAPSRGSLVSLPEGAWKYTPNRDFAGIDSATITVFDGIDTADLTLHWDVHPVNDPPIALHIQLPDLPENSEPGTAIGFISVEDPDLNPNYRVTTTDARFRVESGQVFFVDGDLDYETEPEITFEVIATDQDNTDFAITMETTLQLSDINESPSGFELHGGTVDENVPGATIGDLRVIDPDADSQYDVELSDPRFTLLDGALKLVDGESLDHEQEPQVTIGVFASERDGSCYYNILSQTFVGLPYRYKDSYISEHYCSSMDPLSPDQKHSSDAAE
ncbi:MAG: Ig-like domain-containing protein [Planctomycetota bacterium]